MARDFNGAGVDAGSDCRIQRPLAALCAFAAVLAALLAAHAHGDGFTADAKASLTRTINDLVARGREESTGRGWADIDVDVALPATMALIISTAMLNDWLFPPEIGLDRERILKELIRYEVRAITGGDR